MAATQAQIIGSTGQRQNIMEVNNSGAVPVAGYYNGVVYPLLVNSAGQLETSASVSVGSITAGSESYIFGKSGTGWVEVLVDSIGRLETTASVTVDKVYIASGADIGSVYLKDGAYVNIISSGTTGIPISGVITIGDMNGSVAITTNPVPVSGIITVENLATAGSLAVQEIIGSVDVTQGTNPWIVTGSVNIDNASAIGSIGTQNVDITSTITLPISGVTTSEQGTNPWIVLGSVYNTAATITPVSGTILETDECQMVRSIMTAKKPDSSFINIDATAGGNLKVSIEEANDGALFPVSGNNLAGSFAITTSPVPVSGIINTLLYTGSEVWQGTNPWITLGSMNVNNASSIGSLAIQNIAGTVAISTSPIPVSGIINTQLYAGSGVWQGTSPWIVTGSVNVNPITGSPCFKQSTSTASGAYTQVWGVTAGNRVEVQGWKVSTHLPGFVRLLCSGTTLVNISDYYLNYGSGAVIEKTFANPIVPGGANINLGFSSTVAGSTSVTIYGREVA